MKYTSLKRIATVVFLSAIFLASCSSTPINSQRYSEAELDQRVKALLSQLTLDEKISLIHANGKFSVAGVERLGIPEMWLSDGPHGVRQEISRHSWSSAGWTNDYATYLPTLTAVAASWDPEMASLHGRVLGAEARHRNKDIILGPGVNLARLTLYGRNFEYFGEDPLLTAKLAVPEVIAIQEQDVAACVKHYALNTQELKRSYVDSKPDERTLREVYLPAFEAVVKEAGTHTIMGAYNKVYGVNSNQNKLLVNDILKNEWGYDGILLTDWDVKINTYDAVMNGLDLEMGTDVKNYNDYHMGKNKLKPLIESGKIPVEVLDDKVYRILRMQHEIGMYDKNRKKGARNTKEHIEAARQIAEQSVVLLKNEKALLPLQTKTLKTVLVMGPNSNREHASGGGSSQVKTPYEVTPVEGLRNILGDTVEIIHLRAESTAKIKPIAPDYILNRNWGSGTPTWDYFYFDSAERPLPGRHEQIAESRRAWPAGTTIQYLTASTQIQPLADGPHTFHLEADGKAQLSLDDKNIIPATQMKGNTISYTANLKAGQTYKVELKYDGAKHFTLGWDAPGLTTATKAEYLKVAKDVDAVFYFGGLSHEEDREAKDRDNMKLPGQQDEVIEELLASNPNTVVFLVAGSAVEMPWVDKAHTLVWAWYGGLEGGNAYANVLTGKVNPGAKLPITLPKKLEDTAAIKLNDYNAKEMLYKEGVYIGYRWHEQQNIEPLFPFGYGLSYTSFKVSKPSIPSTVTPADENIKFTVEVKNTGKIAGAEVIQLYLGDKEASVSRPAKELKGFQKVFLQPGESKQVTITITPRELAFWDVDTKNWKIEPGVFTAYLGTSIKDIKFAADFNYQR